MLDGLPIDWDWLDVALAGVLTVIALNALRRGFVREAGTRTDLALGIMVADQFAPTIAERLGPVPGVRDLARIVTIGLVAATITVLVGTVRNALIAPQFSLADRMAGLALGLAEGAAGIGLVLYATTRVGLGGLVARAAEGSLLAPIFVGWWVWLSGLLPAVLVAPRLVLGYLKVAAA